MKLGEDKWQDLGLGDVNFKIYKAQLLQGLGDPSVDLVRFSLVEKTHPVHPEKRSIFGNEVYISMDTGKFSKNTMSFPRMERWPFQNFGGLPYLVLVESVNTWETLVIP